MPKTRVNIGGSDWHVGMTMVEFENALESYSYGFLHLPLLLDEKPHANMRVRPSQIKYYYEEL